MDLVRLSSDDADLYIPEDTIIEGYNSLVWTERFQSPGEFVLTTFDVDRMTKLLPEDSFVSHLETKEVMRVETHEISMVGEGADAQPELTIRGRSASAILEHRWVESSYQKKRRLRRKYSATGAMAVLIYNAVANASGFDVTRGDDDPDTEGVVNSYPWNTKDVLPKVSVTDSVAETGETRWWQVEEGVLYPQLQKIMIDADLGIRCIRPVVPNSATVVTVQSALASRGTIVRTTTPSEPNLKFDIYSGIDRTATVKFSFLQGHLEKPTYLDSTRDYKTVAEVMSGEVSVGDIYRPGESGLTGWQRKVMGFDAGTPEIPPEPERPKEPGKNATNAEKNAYADALDAWKTKHAKWQNKRDAIAADFREEQSKAALRELKRARKVRMFSADISELSPYKYKIHYDLGDKVMLHGDYGRTAAMIVSEYVRTSDINGDRGFPGFVAP